MMLRCPNCGAPWTAPTNTCDNCGATFISGRARARELEEVRRFDWRRVDYRNLLGLIAGSAAGAAWGAACVFAVGVCTLRGGSCEQIPVYFKNAIASGPAPWLAWAAVGCGIVALLLARGRGAGWVGVVGGGLLLTLRMT